MNPENQRWNDSVQNPYLFIIDIIENTRGLPLQIVHPNLYRQIVDWLKIAGVMMIEDASAQFIADGVDIEQVTTGKMVVRKITNDANDNFTVC